MGSTSERGKARISHSLYELMQLSIEWVMRKLEAGEGFSALMMSSHPQGKKATKYSYDSVEEALEAAERELAESLNDASAYAISYDAWFMDGDNKLPVIICRAEEVGLGTQVEFAFPYEFEMVGDAKKVKPRSRPRYLRQTDKALLGVK